MSDSIIDCPNCTGKIGEYLGEINENNEVFNLHKCVKCRFQVKTKKEGVIE